MGKSSTSTACWSCFKSTDSVVTFTSAWQSTQGLRVNHVVPRLLRDLTDRLHRTDRTIQRHEDGVVGLSTCRHAKKGSDLKCWSFRNQAALTIKKLRLIVLFDQKCRIVDKLWSYLSSLVQSIDAELQIRKNWHNHLVQQLCL